MKKWYTYILTNKKNGTLYVGVTSNLSRRIDEHQQKVISWFSSRYWLKLLVYFEEFASISEAIAREKQLKSGNRSKKIELIEKDNPERKDLSLLFE